MEIGLEHSPPSLLWFVKYTSRIFLKDLIFSLQWHKEWCSKTYLDLRPGWRLLRHLTNTAACLPIRFGKTQPFFLRNNGEKCWPILARFSVKLVTEAQQTEQRSLTFPRPTALTRRRRICPSLSKDLNLPGFLCGGQEPLSTSWIMYGVKYVTVPPLLMQEVKFGSLL